MLRDRILDDGNEIVATVIALATSAGYRISLSFCEYAKLENAKEPPTLIELLCALASNDPRVPVGHRSIKVMEVCDDCDARSIYLEMVCALAGVKLPKEVADKVWSEGRAALSFPSSDIHEVTEKRETCAATGQPFWAIKRLALRAPSTRTVDAEKLREVCLSYTCGAKD